MIEDCSPMLHLLGFLKVRSVNLIVVFVPLQLLEITVLLLLVCVYITILSYSCISIMWLLTPCRMIDTNSTFIAELRNESRLWLVYLTFLCFLYGFLRKILLNWFLI